MHVRKQNIKSKIGEVTYRKELIAQFTGKKIVSPGQPTREEFLKIIDERCQRSKLIFTDFVKKSVTLSPFLEIGAGTGHTSWQLINDFGSQGFASDISAETLRLGVNLSQKKSSNRPILICCDAYNLPFQTGSLPFIFCFQTLHHFPDPKPVLREVKRVLTPGGYFYFGEEPIAQAVNLNLWRRDMHLLWFEKILKYILILHFISRIGKSEVDRGILEETFSFRVWERALNIFDHARISLKTFPFGPTLSRNKKGKKRWLKPSPFNHFLINLLGAGISGLCQTNKKIIKVHNHGLHNLLGCPNCQNKPPLVYKSQTQTFLCLHCRTQYHKHQGVYILLARKQQELLYPNLINQ